MSHRVEVWLKSANQHRKDAEQFESISRPYAIYASQQAAEIALKCAILATGSDFRKIHNLGGLWMDLSELIPDMPPLTDEQREDFRNLSLLNLASRYPTGDEDEAHFESLTEATVRMAARTREFIFDTLEEVLPEIFKVSGSYHKKENDMEDPSP